MKKIMSILLFLSLSGCMKQEQVLICSTISQDESTRINIEYSYTNNKKITYIKKTTSVTFQEETLKGQSLQEKQKDIQKEYESYQNVEGLQYAILLEEDKKEIKAEIEVDLSLYDFKKDSFTLGKKADYEDITKVIQEINELGYYHCEEN